MGTIDIPRYGDRHATKTIVWTMGATIIASLITFGASIAATAGGDGVLLHLAILYPWALIAAIPALIIGQAPAVLVFGTVALGQFPVYAVLVLWSYRSRAKRIAKRLAWTHFALASILVVLRIATSVVTGR